VVKEIDAEFGQPTPEKVSKTSGKSL